MGGWLGWLGWLGWVGGVELLQVGGWRPAWVGGRVAWRGCRWVIAQNVCASRWSGWRQRDTGSDGLQQWLAGIPYIRYYGACMHVNGHTAVKA